MKEYKIIHRSAAEVAFDARVKPDFEEQLNKLAQEDWEVKTFKIDVIRDVENGDYISSFALLQRDRK